MGDHGRMVNRGGAVEAALEPLTRMSVTGEYESLEP